MVVIPATAALAANAFLRAAVQFGLYIFNLLLLFPPRLCLAASRMIVLPSDEDEMKAKKFSKNLENSKNQRSS
jgi:hypothetical protein